MIKHVRQNGEYTIFEHASLISLLVKESYEENLTVILECEDDNNLEAATVEKVISLLWKAPVLQSAALKILATACLQEFQKQTQNTVCYNLA